MFPPLFKWLSVLINRGCGTQPQGGVEPDHVDREPLAVFDPEVGRKLAPSNACYKLVRDFEGLSLEAYRCPAGVLTIGYGHTGNVYVGQRISLDDARNMLISDLEKVANNVCGFLSTEVTQGQFDALCSFGFNVGVWDGGLSTSTLLRKLNQGDVQGAGKEFGRWVYATVNGKKVKMKGLERRREAEAKLFLTGQYP